MRLAILSILLLLPAAQAGQVVLSGTATPQDSIQHDTVVNAFATTTIDILSSSGNHSTFLHLLQRTKLVPTLNLVQGSTVFAPTDEAWRAWGEAKGVGVRAFINGDGDAREEVTDNILFGLRQHLLYHILNYTIHDVPSKAESYVTTETTLLFPNRPIMPPSPHKPPTGSPWMPQGGDGDLGGMGQQLRLHHEDGAPRTVGCDSDGEGGAEVWEEWPVKKKERKVDDGEIESFRKTDGGVRYASNGVVIALNRVMDPPSSIGE